MSWQRRRVVPEHGRWIDLPFFYLFMLLFSDDYNQLWRTTAGLTTFQQVFNDASCTGEGRCDWCRLRVQTAVRAERQQQHESEREIRRPTEAPQLGSRLNKMLKKNWPRVGPIWRKPLQRFHLSRFFWGSWTETVFTRFFLGLLNTWMNKLTIFDGKFKAKYFFNYLYIMNKPKIVEKGWS